MRAIKAPNPINTGRTTLEVKLFLAGSIEQGKAIDWQQAVIDRLTDLDGVIWNPRREVWDSTWEQDINNPPFKEQVMWELGAIEVANIVAFYFEPNTLSPITMMELGFVCGLTSMNVLVYCPKGFWRKGNVDVICELHNIPVYETEEEFMEALRTKVINENRYRKPYVPSNS
jgi:hypothetical protein